MISPPPKPFCGIIRCAQRIQGKKALRRPERILKRNQMTLAIGMACAVGYVFAADTRLVFDDGTTTDMSKMTCFNAGKGQFAIIQSSYDANAANSLMREVANKTIAAKPENLDSVENAVKAALQAWYLPVHENRPGIQLLIGACFKHSRAMYLCEPPHTVALVSDSYIAIGGGRTIADPINAHWFEDLHPHTPHACLCRISYLMYKAKQLLPAHVGGHTDAVLITAPSDWEFPYFIERESMKDAESLGVKFDQAISRVACSAMSLTSQNSAVVNYEGSIRRSVHDYTQMKFYCEYPPHEVIDRDFNL
jgi:hypothetical protein